MNRLLAVALVALALIGSAFAFDPITSAHLSAVIGQGLAAVPRAIWHTIVSALP